MPVPQKNTYSWLRDIFLSRLLWQSSVSVQEEAAVHSTGLGVFDHLPPQGNGSRLGGNSVKVFKRFTEGPGRVFGRNPLSTIMGVIPFLADLT